MLPVQRGDPAGATDRREPASPGQAGGDGRLRARPGPADARPRVDVAVDHLRDPLTPELREQEARSCAAARRGSRPSSARSHSCRLNGPIAFLRVV